MTAVFPYLLLVLSIGIFLLTLHFNYSRRLSEVREHGPKEFNKVKQRAINHATPFAALVFIVGMLLYVGNLAFLGAWGRLPAFFLLLSFLSVFGVAALVSIVFYLVALDYALQKAILPPGSGFRTVGIAFLLLSLTAVGLLSLLAILEPYV